MSVGVGVDLVTNKEIELRLQPNPNKGIFTVKGTVGITDQREAFIEVTDMLGQVVYEAKVEIRDSMVNERIELNNTLANGTYLLHFRMGGDKAVFHFVIGQ
jgi:hypothetical protein